jgi:hypothetical protein
MSAPLCCLLAGLAVAPALNRTVPAPPASNPGRPDITIIVQESYLNQALTEALPGQVPGEAKLDVRSDNRLVVITEFDLLLQKLQVVVTLRLSAQDGQLQIVMDSVEAGGYDILNLLDVDGETLGRAMSRPIQRQVEAGLGEGARILGVSTDEEQMVITAKWASQSE